MLWFLVQIFIGVSAAAVTVVAGAMVWSVIESRAMDFHASVWNRIGTCFSDGDDEWILAHQERSAVAPNKVALAILKFQKPVKLYGPIIQSIMAQRGEMDELWWRCYKEIYLDLPPRAKQNIRRIMAAKRFGFAYGFPYALQVCRGRLYSELRPELERLSSLKCGMQGADEYDEVLAAQTLMEEINAYR